MPLSEARADYTCLVDEIRAQIRATFETSLIRFFQDRERSPCSQRLCRDLEVLEVDPWSRIPKAERENIQRNYVYMQDVLSHALDIESSDKELRLDLLRRMFLRNPNIFYQTELPRGLAMFVTNSSSAVPSTLSFLER